MTRNSTKFGALPGALVAVAMGLALAGCGRSTPDSQTPTADAAAQEEQAKAHEQELADREAAVAAKEKEQEAARLAEVAAQKEREAADAAAAAAAAKKAAARKPARSTSTASTSTPSSAAPAPKPAPKPVSVPAGTQLTVGLSSDLTTKTAKVGDTFDATVTSDVMVGERRAVPAGTRVTGTVTDVISGSHAIGAVPLLGLRFDTLVLETGQTIPIRGELKEQGKSEKGRDTAKILGGAAAGAILGHQVKKGDSGKVIGGLLGGAVGAVAAKKTGTEVMLPAGSTLTISLGEGFTVAP